MKNIYYLCSSLSPSIDYWILNELKKKGTSVKTVDISDILIPHMKSIEGVKEDYTYDFSFESVDSLLDFCRTLNSNDVVFSPTSASIMNDVRSELTLNDVKVICDTSFGLPRVHIKKPSKVRRLKILIKENGIYKVIIKLLLARVKRGLKKLKSVRNVLFESELSRSNNIIRRRKLRENLYIIVSGERSHYQFSSVNTSLNHIKVPHSSIAFFETDSSQTCDSKKIVFIDQAIPFHRDSKRKGYNYEAYADDYYKDTVKFLKRVQESYPDHEVLVALHPRSLANNADYGEFECIQGRTNELVKACDLVLCHYSTVIYTAVYYGKPIIMYTNDLIEMHHDREYVYEFSRLVGSLVLNSSSDVPGEIKVNSSLYRSFKENYIVQSDAARDRAAIDIILDKALS
ncbi:conserved hypothetical protein [Vibrio chagasii]|nr:conserved hypothetical protein [Vibrio chagasii]CAH6908983.1 conserved hypothetical protein [Vibrio chagasii]